MFVFGFSEVTSTIWLLWTSESVCTTLKLMCFSLVWYMLIYCKNWGQKMSYCLYYEKISHGWILAVIFCLSLKLQFAVLCLPCSGKFSFQIFICKFKCDEWIKVKCKPDNWYKTLKLVSSLNRESCLKRV